MGPAWYPGGSYRIGFSGACYTLQSQRPLGRRKGTCKDGKQAGEICSVYGHCFGSGPFPLAKTEPVCCN